MRRLGTVTGTAQGLAIVRLDDDEPPSIGATVVDESLEELGRVVDVFGPVSAPLVAVTITDDRPLAGVLGDKLYAR